MESFKLVTVLIKGQRFLMLKTLASNMLFFYVILALFICVRSLSSLDSEPYSMNVNMPDVRPSMPDDYICTAKKLNPAESYIVQYEPDADGRVAHHMLLFGCKSLHSQNHLYPGHWNCGGDLCSRMTIMYGWAKNAPAMKLPPKVGFLVGGNSSIQYLVLQIHYAKTLPDGMTDNSGLKLHMTTQRQKYVTGIHLLLADSAVIPPRRLKYYVDVNCKFKGNFPIHVFAYRVHTHKLGTVVSGYKFNIINNSWSFLSKGNPQWPQAFYPMEKVQTITDDDILAARCTYDSSKLARPVQIGSSSSDEMCNLYLMYYTEYRNGILNPSIPCVGVEFYDLVPALPHGNDIPLPSNPVLEQRAYSGHGKPSDTSITYNDVENSRNFDFDQSHHTSSNHHQIKNPLKNDNIHSKHTAADNYAFFSSHFNPDFKYSIAQGWPSRSLNMGQVVAVTTNADGDVVIFHRGNHVWNELTFDLANNYLPINDGPVSSPTIITLDVVSGMVVHQWGENLFYMPHGLFISPDGSYWLTDVALHQVFHFPQSGGSQPILTLGEKFVPGSDREHFCKPASVAISNNGDIYVADGYCNSRIVRFSSEGKFLNQWGKQHNEFDPHPPVGTFRIPHKVVLLEDRNLVCVADRENGRIQCFTIEFGVFHFQIQHEEFGGTVYSIAYSQEKGSLYAVNGEDIYKNHPVKGFIFNVTDQKLLNVFAPKSGTFTRPHDIAVNHDEIYVCEIGPNVVWKFIREYHKSTKKVLNIPKPEPTNLDSLPGKHVNHKISSPNAVTHVGKNHTSNTQTLNDSAEEMDSFETSMIIMALLSIPVLILIVITIVMRLKKRGKLQAYSFGHLKGWIGGYRTPHPQDKLNIGTLLNRHKGFDRVALEESDGDENGSDSDVEEFSAINKKNLA